MGNDEERNTINFCYISDEFAGWGEDKRQKEFRVADEFEVKVGIHQGSVVSLFLQLW